MERIEKQLADDVIGLLQKNRRRPLTASEISRQLDLRGKSRKKLQKALHQLVVDRDAQKTSSGSYTIASSAKLIKGQVAVRRSGSAIVTSEEDGSEIFVPERFLNNALPGDTVLVRMLPPRPGGRDSGWAGSVVSVVRRSAGTLVGTLRKDGHHLNLVPFDPSYGPGLKLSEEAVRGKVNDRVVARLVPEAEASIAPKAQVIEVIGPSDDATLDTRAVIRQFGFRQSFAPEVKEEAQRAVGLMGDGHGRVDLRDAFVFTIDPATARDFDDALSLERDERGNRLLGVHIADVSHFVQPNGHMDREARRRGNSVYFPNTVLPMLPEALSNGVCSLRPHEDKYTVSAFITVNDAGVPIARKFARSVIRSRLRLTYEQAAEALQAGPDDRLPFAEPDAVGVLKQVNALAQQMRARRVAESALNLDVPEYDIVLDSRGLVADVRLVENNESHQLIEECMLAANEAVMLELASRGLNTIQRAHEPPSEDRIKGLMAQFAELGLRTGNLLERRRLAAFLNGIGDKPLDHYVKRSVLRSMKRAVYSTKPTGHFALAKRWYTHFTSPIRRYPDLIVHRSLIAALGSKPRPYGADELAVIADACTRTEQAADDAERFLVETKVLRLLAAQAALGAPRAYDALVLGRVRAGFLVELMDFQIKGIMDPHSLSARGRHPPPRLTVGQRIRVFPRKVAVDDRDVWFAPAH